MNFFYALTFLVISLVTTSTYTGCVRTVTKENPVDQLIQPTDTPTPPALAATERPKQPLKDVPAGCWSGYSGSFMWIGDEEMISSTDRSSRVTFRPVDVARSSAAGKVYELVDRPRSYFFQRYITFALGKNREGQVELSVIDSPTIEGLADRQQSLWVTMTCVEVRPLLEKNAR